jgi:predicted double-glycine peptidase
MGKPTQEPKPVKPMEERLQESMTILRKLQDLGVPSTDPSYKELSGKFSEWVKGGETWQGNVDFYRFNRRAKVLLPTRPGAVAKCDFLVYQF